MATEILSAEYVRTILDYEPLTGVFTWRKMRSTRRMAGEQAGCIKLHGYREIGINGGHYRAHRLAWFYVHGAWPPDEIDHINRVKDDNRIANLRLADRSLNSQNRAIPSNNRSGVKGVYWLARRNRWMATIGVGGSGKRKYLGLFTDICAAEQAYKAAAAIYHTV